MRVKVVLVSACLVVGACEGGGALVPSPSVTTAAATGHEPAPLDPSVPAWVVVPDLVFQPLGSAKDRLGEVYLAWRVRRVLSTTTPSGTVLSHRPGPGTRLRPGRVVRLRVAAQPDGTRVASFPRMGSLYWRCDRATGGPEARWSTSFVVGAEDGATVTASYALGAGPSVHRRLNPGSQSATPLGREGRHRWTIEYSHEDGTFLADAEVTLTAEACRFPWLPPPTVITIDPVG